MKVLCLFLCILLLSGCCLENIPLDSYVTGSIQHVTCDDPSSGSIVQEWNPCLSSLGISNQTYAWNNGSTDKDVSNLSPNYPFDYKCNVGYRFLNANWVVPKKYGVRYDVEWSHSPLFTYSQDYKTLYRNFEQPNTVGSICSKNILPDNAVGCMEFQCLTSSGSGTVYIGFDDLACPSGGSVPSSTFTGFEIMKSGSQRVWTLYRNGLRLENGSGTISASGTFTSSDKFEIKYGNGVHFLINGNMIPIPLMYTQLYVQTHRAFRIRCHMVGGGVTLQNVRSSFACSNGSDYYAELKKELDGSCYTMTGAVNFVYKEKYDDNNLNYTIYDWQRNPVLSSSGLSVISPNVTGVNYHIIPVGSLLQDEFYTLEVTNSKGEVYKMRFRYIGVISTNNVFTVSAVGPGGPVKPTYVGPANVDPTIKVSVNTPKSINSVIDIQNGLDYE